MTVTPLDGQPIQGAVVMHVDITAEKRGQQSLLRFAAAMDATMDAIYVIDRADMELIHFNDAACRMQGKTREEVLAGGPPSASGIARAELERIYDRLIAGAHVEEPQELLRHRADGTPYWLEVRRQALLLDQRWTIVSLVRDVTERKHAEQRIRQLNRVQSMLSGINTLIVRVRDRPELFREACRIAVEAGGFAMAWIGIVDRALLSIVPVASVGATEALLSCIEEGLSLVGTAADRSPTVRVIRDKKSNIVNDAAASVRTTNGRIYAEAGIRAFAILPLVVADEAVGVLALYARDVNFFHDDEMKLLTELAGDVAFAIDHIAKQEKLQYLSLYDPLTGLANRTLFLDRVTQFLRAAASGSPMVDQESRGFEPAGARGCRSICTAPAGGISRNRPVESHRNYTHGVLETSISLEWRLISPRGEDRRGDVSRRWTQRRHVVRQRRSGTEEGQDGRRSVSLLCADDDGHRGGSSEPREPITSGR
jgi:PAS domain S-box-containing protein